jgi:hypothetical protein
MLSLTIVGLQEIIPKLMALLRRWFRHARKDYERFASLGTKRTLYKHWPSLTSPWVTGCPNTRLCLISLFTFYFLGDIHSYDILGARMLWKPKEARILKNLKKNYRSTSVIW